MPCRILQARTAGGGMQSWKGWTLPTCTGPDPNAPAPAAGNCLYDVSNPAARAFLWDRLKASYFDKGILNFWTDGILDVGLVSTAPPSLPSSLLFPLALSPSLPLSLSLYLPPPLSPSLHTPPPPPPLSSMSLHTRRVPRSS